jgi:phage tail sheath gpL-like
MTGGTVDPTSLSDALDSFAGSRYHKIAISLNDSTSLGTLSTHLKSICGTASTKFAIGMFGTNNATLATVTALAEAVDYERIQCHYLRGSLSPGYDIAAAYMALATYVDDPSLPLNGCQVFGLNVPLVPSQFNDTEIEELLWAGVSPLIVDEQSCVAVKRSITTNVSDARMLDVTTITGWDYFRFAFVQRCKQVFAQAKNLVSTPAAVKTQALFVAQQCEDAQMGVTGVAQYQDKFTAEKDASDPTRVNVTVPSPIIPGLQRICARFDLYY